MIRIKIKKPNLLSSVFSAGFILLGIHLIRKAVFDNESFFTYAILIIGILTVLLFGTFLFFLVSRYFDHESGLQLDDEKLIFKPNKFQNAVIHRKDISEIQYQSKRGQHYILPIVKNPEEIISAQNSWLGRRVMKMNFREFQTPVPIFANNYECSFEELKKMMTNKLNRAQHNN